MANTPVGDEPNDDEKLDELLDTGRTTPASPLGQPSDNPDDPAPKNPANPDEGDEDEDDYDLGVDVPEDSDDPKDIAIRNLRNKTKRQKKTIDKLRTPQTPTSPAAPEPTAARPKAGSPLYDRFLNQEFRSNVLFAQQTDPTVAQRVPMIKKIMFEEMPELLDKPNGFELANDMAKGRLIEVVVPAKGADIHPQTSPARTPGAAPKPKKQLSQAEYDKLTEPERVAYENSLIGA